MKLKVIRRLAVLLGLVVLTVGFGPAQAQATTYWNPDPDRYVLRNCSANTAGPQPDTAFRVCLDYHVLPGNPDMFVVEPYVLVHNGSTRYEHYIQAAGLLLIDNNPVESGGCGTSQFSKGGKASCWYFKRNVICAPGREVRAKAHIAVSGRWSPYVSSLAQPLDC
jgi:hypothetical protein